MLVLNHFWLFWNGPGLFTSYLSCRNQSLFVGHESSPSTLKCGVPQGSVLGPLYLFFFAQPLSTVICQSGHSCHFFADNSQLDKSNVLPDFPALVHSLKDCTADVTRCLSDSKLKMNDDNTELIAIDTKSTVSQVTSNLSHVSISVYDIPFSQSFENLGFFLDKTLCMDKRMKLMCRILLGQLHRLEKIRPFHFTASFILTKLDCCDCLLAGLPDNKLNTLHRTQ